MLLLLLVPPVAHPSLVSALRFNNWCGCCCGARSTGRLLAKNDFGGVDAALHGEVAMIGAGAAYDGPKSRRSRLKRIVKGSTA